ncbi:MAG: SDR family oxidoreductase [Nanoarchaeota archaeon]
MDLKLNGKVAFIAGASQGIGLAIAETLQNEGARVIITGRDEQRLADAERQLGKDCVAILGDLTQEDIIAPTLAEAVKRCGRIDILIANVGSGVMPVKTAYTPEEWLECFQKNFLGSMLLTGEFIPYLEKTKGSIIFIASIAGIEGIKAPMPYAAAKASLLSAMKSLAHQLGKKGIRVNAISPGNILFPGGRWEEKLKKDKTAIEEYIACEVPLNRFGTAQEIADVAAFLASSKAAFITGANIVVDGGQTRSW